ncbi:MAG: MgtC/SapB family protein [Deltaproteobacteria bacterium]|nr:MgtC/SapB family protein [Deltaproteobacteria bacterium]
MEPQTRLIFEHLLTALGAGALIGFERSYHGRPAGFRTHALVCVASSALMLVTLYQERWFPAAVSESLSIDPTRMAQGIMTGIGFLGAGVIFKGGLTVRGLTTAASIWITAAIGILAGIGFYSALIITTLLTVGTLSAFRWFEAKMPVELYAQLEVRFSPEAAIREPEFRRLITDHGFSVARINYRYDAEERFFQYGTVIRTRDAANAGRLSEALRSTSTVRAFELSPMGG